MADKKISELTAASALDGTETFAAVQSGTTKKATVAQVRDYLGVQVLAQSAVQVSHTGDTTETTVATITVPANAMGANGQIEIRALFTTPNNANNKTIKIKFGGTVIHNINYTTTLSAQVHKRIANRNATNSQIAAPIASIDQNTSASGNLGAVVTAAVDTTASQDILITVTCGSAADTIKLESYIVLLFPKA